MTNATPYDEILYPTGAHESSHPDRLATIATLFGMNPAPVTRCRVLEIGCGNGANLIPMAFHLPESRFTGFDLAGKPIDAGNSLATSLGLRNLVLEAKDLMTVTPGYGEFDYIIAHGMYAWLPAPVQDKLMEICRANLAPQGVAFVSYNAYPGSRLKETVRDLFAQFVRPFSTSPEGLARARGLLEFAKTARRDTGPWGPTMGQVATVLGNRPDSVLAHDEMGEHYHPAYFHEFAAHAGRHGLQYLGEADYNDMYDRWLRPEELEYLGGLEGDPVLLREQYMDFMKLRTFRNTLICRREVRLDREGAARAALKLLVSSRLRPASDKPNLETVGEERFVGPEGGGITVSILGIKQTLARLGAEWPRPVPVAELVSKHMPAEQLGDFLVVLYASTMAALRTSWNPYVGRAGERPVASRLSRLVVDRRPWITSHEHTEVELTDPITRRLLSLLDGTRDRAAILQELRTLEAGITLEQLEKTLGVLADLALLTA